VGLGDGLGATTVGDAWGVGEGERTMTPPGTPLVFVFPVDATCDWLCIRLTNTNMPTMTAMARPTIAMIGATREVRVGVVRGW
jgi:hypothetical protein